MINLCKKLTLKTTKLMAKINGIVINLLENKSEIKQNIEI